MHDAVIVGGGIAGLTAGLDLARAGLDVVVLEAKPSAGGNIATLDHDGFKLETGPHSFMGSAESVWRLVEELGAEDAAEPAAPIAATRYIYRDGRLEPLPLGVGAFLRSGVLSFGGKLRLAAEPFIRNGADPDETAWEFFSRRFGEEAATYIMSPFISGVYAGDIHALGARAAFPRFWGFERESGSMIRGAMRYMGQKRRRLRAAGKPLRRGLFSFGGGLGTLIARLADQLGERLRTGVEVRAVARHPGSDEVLCRTDDGELVARRVIVAAPPHRAAPILEAAVPRAAEVLRSIPMVPVSVAHWTLPDAPPGGEAPRVPEGFGFLVPRVSGLRLLGTLFPSQLFADRAPAGRHLLVSYYGGATDAEAAVMPDEALTALLQGEHRPIFGGVEDASQVLRILRHPAAIPQLLPDHPERIASIQSELEAVPGLDLAGNYLVGVGIEAAVESGYAAAARCRAALESDRAQRGAA